MRSKILCLAAVGAVAMGLILTAALSMGLYPIPYPAPMAYAAGTIIVDTTTDEYDDIIPNGTCSLREAIQSINTASSFGGCTNPANAADTIQLGATTYTLTRGPATYDNSAGALYLNNSMIIQGAGSGQTTITTSVTDRVLYIYKESDNVYVTLQGLTVQGGNVSGSSGGGIYASISDAYPYGDAPAEFTLNDVVVKDNQSSSGGGIYISIATTATFTDVTIENNQATANGGGLCIGEGGQFSLNRVTIYNNRAGFGGGVYYQNQYSDVSLDMINTTIYSNSATTSGGGLYLNYHYTTAAYAIANNVTFANNKAISAGGGNIYSKQSAISMANTIVTGGIDNTGANNCAGDPSANITSGGYNLDSGTSCGLSGTGDLTSTDPKLATALADNGGKTQTLALLDGSPAINQGNPAAPGSGGNACAGADQRGMTRPQGGRCDIGAYEYEYEYLPTYLPLILKN